MASGKTVKHEYSANMRRALYEGLVEAAKEQGMTLTEYCQQWWNDDWKAAINAMAKFMPRENQVSGKVEHDHKHEHTHVDVSQVDGWLAQFATGSEDSDTQETLPH